jgi:AraC family transcriptional regulator
MISPPLHRSVRTRWAHIHEFVLPPHCPIPAHTHGPPHVMLMLSGSLCDRDDESAHECVRGSMRYSPGSDPHRVEIGAAGAHVMVVEARGFPELHLTKRVYFAAADAASLAERIRARLVHEAVLSPAAIEDCALTLFSFVRDQTRATRVRHHEWIARVRDSLGIVDVSRTPMADAAASVGRHASVVGRVFRATYGVSIHRYYRRLQVDRAWALLADETLGLSAVATGAGFADQSHLSRVLRAELGMTPAAVRDFLREAPERRNWYLASPLRGITRDRDDGPPGSATRIPSPTRQARSRESASRRDRARS